MAAWLEDNKSIAKRVRALTAECDPLMEKYGMKGMNQGAKLATRGGQNSHLTASASQAYYKDKIGCLRSHARTALATLSEIGDVSSDKRLRELNKVRGGGEVAVLWRGIGLMHSTTNIPFIVYF